MRRVAGTMRLTPQGAALSSHPPGVRLPELEKQPVGTATRKRGVRGEALVHAFSLSAALFVLWLLLSGHFEPLLISLGVASCLFVAFIAHRMDLVDREGHPIHLTWRALTYWPWLASEIAKSNIEVARLILDPRLPIGARCITVETSQKSDLGRVVYANSITLTPGTVSIFVWPDSIQVHALTRALAEGLENGEMDRRVTAMEGES